MAIVDEDLDKRFEKNKTEKLRKSGGTVREGKRRYLDVVTRK